MTAMTLGAVDSCRHSLVRTERTKCPSHLCLFDVTDIVRTASRCMPMLPDNPNE